MGAWKERRETRRKGSRTGGDGYVWSCKMTVELIFVWEGGSADIKCRKIALNLQVGGKMLVSCRAAKQTRPSLLSFLLGPIVHMGLSPLAC